MSAPEALEVPGPAAAVGWTGVACLDAVGFEVDGGVDVALGFMLVGAGLTVVAIRREAAVGAASRCVGEGSRFWMGGAVVGESEISKSTEVSTGTDTVKRQEIVKRRVGLIT